MGSFITLPDVSILNNFFPVFHYHLSLERVYWGSIARNYMLELLELRLVFLNSGNMNIKT